MIISDGVKRNGFLINRATAFRTSLGTVSVLRGLRGTSGRRTRHSPFGGLFESAFDFCEFFKIALDGLAVRLFLLLVFVHGEESFLVEEGACAWDACALGVDSFPSLAFHELQVVEPLQGRVVLRGRTESVKLTWPRW